MFAAILFSISIVALSQFAVYYWRAMLAGAAAQPVSERTLSAAHVQDGHFTGEEFATLVRLHQLTPELQRSGSGLRLVRLYYWMVNGMGSVLGSRMLAIAAWSQQEMAVCARYAAVQMDRRLQANFELAASLRSC
jgi:hypothetical protein